MDALRQWMQERIGIAPGIQDALVLPLLAILLLWIVRELVLLVALRTVSDPRRRRIWRQASLYAALVLGIVALGGVWLTSFQRIADILSEKIGAARPQVENNLLGAIYAFLATCVFLLLLRLTQGVFRTTIARLGAWSISAKEIRYQNAVLVTPDRIRNSAVAIMRGVRALLVVALFYFYVPLVLSFFPGTAPLAGKLVQYIAIPAAKIGKAIVDYLPNLIYLILIVIVVRYTVKLFRFLLSAVGKGEIVLPGFDVEWAEPTFKLLRAVAVLFTVMISYPYLPGAGSEFFKGFSIFVGVLLTIGSTTAIGNIISGIALTYTRSFRIGDRVKIGETLGDILEKTLFVTRVRTIKNEEVTIPNGVVLAGQIVNYSAVARSHGLILHTSVGIGYDVDWRKVHELLKGAARQTADVLQQPEPFVWQTSLGEYAVVYELNAYISEPKKMGAAYSELRKNILDVFHKSGIEIMTPSVGALRDANQPAIPPEYQPKSFQFPGFRFLFPDRNREP